MAYNRKYYFTFKDVHISTPAEWRVDILDNEGATPVDPYLLTPSTNPLITERIETSEEKDSLVIGRQITISYEYTGEPNIPLPTEFFEANERRFRVEVRKNGVLDGVYYIKPDFSEYDEKYPPFTIQLKAVDGFSYAKAIQFNIYDDEQKLLYDKITWYEALMTRALLQVLDPETKLNVINSLIPINIATDVKLLFGTYVHTDIFYDFVKGASTVHDVICAFARSMYSRCFICNNEVWLVRIQDLTGDTFDIEQYTDGTAVTAIDVPGFVATIGPDPSLYTAARIDNVPRVRMIPAIKKAEFEVQYKSINQLSNFDWSIWDGTDFSSWLRFGSPPPTVNRVGAGILDDPYRLLFPESQSGSGSKHIDQDTPFGVVRAGDIVEISFKYTFTNVDTFRLSVRVGNSTTGEYVSLGSDGTWLYTEGVQSNFLIEIKRSGKKRNGSFSIKSAPIPAEIASGTFPDPARLYFNLSRPANVLTIDGSLTPGIEIYPIKIGIIPIASEGRHLTIKNAAQFSQEKDTIPFNFIDTGEERLSNTIFVKDGTDYIASEDWDSSKPDVEPMDIERHMATAHIDQYPRSVTAWEGSLYTNSIEFFNVFQIETMSDKRFMQMSDKYNNMSCTHDILLMEVFPEGNAQVVYTEYDIDDETD